MSTEKYQERQFYSGSSDEIDLLELCNKIWEGRYLVFGVVIANGLIALLILGFITSYYSIYATVDASTEDQLRLIAPSYLKVNDSQLYSIDDKKKSVEYQISYPDTKKIYDRVLLQINSMTVMKAFWEKRFEVSLDLRPGVPETDDVTEFRRFYKSVFLESSNPKTPEVTARKISVEYESSTEGVKILNDYMDFVSEYIWLNYLDDLDAAYRVNLKALETNYQALNKIEQRRLSDKIVVLHENFKLAESLGIKETPFKELENIQLRVLDGKDYLLGTKPIAQQIEILTARQGKSLAPFSVELRNMEIWKDQMNSDLERLAGLKGSVRLFSVINQPESSLDTIRPKKVMIFTAVIFISAFFGICIVFVRSAILTRRLKK